MKSFVHRAHAFRGSGQPRGWCPGPRTYSTCHGSGQLPPGRAQSEWIQPNRTAARSSQTCVAVPSVAASPHKSSAVPCGAPRRALGDPVRLRLLSLLKTAGDGQMCAGHLVEPVGKSQPTVKPPPQSLRARAAWSPPPVPAPTSGTRWRRSRSPRCARSWRPPAEPPPSRPAARRGFPAARSPFPGRTRNFPSRTLGNGRAPHHLAPHLAVDLANVTRE